jgi:hypothetical protein
VGEEEGEGRSEMSDTNGKEQGGNERLDRVERILEAVVGVQAQFAADHKLLLTSQILLTDRLDKLVQAQEENERRFQETDERLGILIKMMDEWIRRHPEPPTVGE